MDRQLRDFKKKVMENNEPVKIKLAKKLMLIVVPCVIAMAVILYIFNIQSYDIVSKAFALTLKKLLR